MDKINDRIYQVLVQKFKNLNKAAPNINIPPSTLRGLCGVDARGKEPQDPKVSQIIEIVKATGCSLDWLVYGRGEMFPDMVEGEPHSVRDTYHVSIGAHAQTPTFNNSIGNQSSSAPVPAVSPDEANECRRLRGQNFELSRNVSSLIDQLHMMTETNRALTARLIALDPSQSEPKSFNP